LDVVLQPVGRSVVFKVAYGREIIILIIIDAVFEVAY
jgi:hypothetical protein